MHSWWYFQRCGRVMRTGERNGKDVLSAPSRWKKPALMAVVVALMTSSGAYLEFAVPRPYASYEAS